MAVLFTPASAVPAESTINIAATGRSSHGAHLRHLAGQLMTGEY